MPSGQKGDNLHEVPFMQALPRRDNGEKGHHHHAPEQRR